MRAGSSSPATSPKAPGPVGGDLATLRQRLLSWYAREARALPWRRPPGELADPYAVWVSEVMLQQTQAATVAPYYQRWMARLPRLADLAAAPLETVLELWQGLGYYGRARRLWQAARQLQAAGMAVPDRPEDLRALPGVGDYTAAAILSIAFGQARPAIDGNLRRVLGRIGALEGDLTRGVGARRLRELAQALVTPDAWGAVSPSAMTIDSVAMTDPAAGADPRATSASVAMPKLGATPGDLNQALMDLGALVCRPVKPDCATCPAETFCRARSLGRTADFPAPVTRAAPRPAAGFAYAIQDTAGRWLLGRRKPEGLLGGLWELPWVTVESVEDRSPGAASRAIPSPKPNAERIPSRPSGLATMAPLAGPPLRHTFTHLRLELRLLRGWLLAAPGLEGVAPTADSLLLDLNRLSAGAYDAWRWVGADEVAALPRSRLMDKLWRRVTESS